MSRTYGKFPIRMRFGRQPRFRTIRPISMYPFPAGGAKPENKNLSSRLTIQEPLTRGDFVKIIIFKAKNRNSLTNITYLPHCHSFMNPAKQDGQTILTIVQQLAKTMQQYFENKSKARMMPTSWAL